MNSAPTAEEQLPPLPEWKTNSDIPADVWDEAIMFVADAPVAEWLVITRRQLLAALRENQEKDARIAELESYKINADHALNLGILDSQELQAKLRAVSDALDSDGVWAHQLPSGDFYWAVDVDARDARIRAILEGK